MIAHRSIVRYNQMSDSFREFQWKCEEKYSKFTEHSSLDRCHLLNHKKECNQKNCPKYENLDS
jgi:hypothetical protein